MNVTDFVPIYGSYRAIKDEELEDLSFDELVAQGLSLGIASFATTVVIGETFGFSHGVVRMAMAGVNPLMYTLGVPVAVGIVGQTVAVTELTQSDVAKEHPWWIAWILGTR